MSKDLIFMKGLQLDRPPKLSNEEWLFEFGAVCAINIGCPWRIISKGSIALGNMDHNQLFGLKEPLNAGDEAFRLLKNKKVIAARLKPVSGDLVIDFEDSMILESFVNSSGYETCQIRCHDGTSIIVVGGGKIVEYRVPRTDADSRSKLPPAF
jgi:hypothetical protein